MYLGDWLPTVVNIGCIVAAWWVGRYFADRRAVVGRSVWPAQPTEGETDE